MNVRQAALEGGRAALAAFGLPSQPSLPSVGIKPPSAPGLPKVGPPSIPSPGAGGGSSTAATPPPKMAFNVGMGASNSSDGAGSPAGEPADAGRRQRSVIDRALQRNDDDYASSSMPLPGAVVSP